ncbi:MAG TPA: FxsA family protein, partial [Polyangiales bacterium]
VRIGRTVGAPTVIAYVITMMFVGSWLIRSQGRRVLEQARAVLEQRRPLEESVHHGAWALLGGLLLIVPGVITDLLALLCFFPFTRRAIAAQFSRALSERVARGTVRVQHFDARWNARPRDVRGDVIDTEGEDVTDEPPRLR